MFAKLFVATVAALSLATSVSAAPIAAPVAKSWDTKKFEPYAVYHARYNALDCKNKHNTKFFTTCCGPLAHGQPLSTRPAECNPASKTSTSSTQDDGNDCEDDGDEDDGSVTTTTLNPTTTTKASTKTTTKAASATTKASSGSSSGGTFHGRGTWYTQDGTTGACGKKHSDSDLIVAMNHPQYGDLNSVSSTCGKKVRITNTANGKQVTATVADACPECAHGSLDLSRGAFGSIGDFNTGVLPITWDFI